MIAEQLADEHHVELRIGVPEKLLDGDLGAKGE